MRTYAAHELAQRIARAPVCLARSHCPLDPACQPPPIYSVVFLTHASTAYTTGARQQW